MIVVCYFELNLPRLFVAGWKLCLMFEKNITKIFYRMYINANDLKYRHARCDWKLCNIPRFYIVFRVFSCTIDEHYSCLKYCIFTKILHIVCLINVNILVCQHAKCDCRLWNVLWLNFVFFGIFLYILQHVWNNIAS